MEVTKVIIIITVTMALSITITMKRINQVEEKPTFDRTEADVSLSSEGLAVHDEDNKLMIMPSKRLSRFLDETHKNPRSSDHCHKDDEKCRYQGYYGNHTACCNNKCMDLSYDNHNCGACKRKCKYTQACCRGECVYLSLDKRHCGACNNRCPRGELCVYGLCNYP